MISKVSKIFFIVTTLSTIQYSMQGMASCSQIDTICSGQSLWCVTKEIGKILCTKIDILTSNVPSLVATAVAPHAI